jgi:hypothetical protein
VTFSWGKYQVQKKEICAKKLKLSGEKMGEINDIPSIISEIQP